MNHGTRTYNEQLINIKNYDFIESRIQLESDDKRLYFEYVFIGSVFRIRGRTSDHLVRRCELFRRNVIIIGYSDADFSSILTDRYVFLHDGKSVGRTSYSKLVTYIPFTSKF